MAKKKLFAVVGCNYPKTERALKSVIQGGGLGKFLQSMNEKSPGKGDEWYKQNYVELEAGDPVPAMPESTRKHWLKKGVIIDRDPKE
jgi:hypothetical protein